jgi:hypothetical protein
MLTIAKSSLTSFEVIVLNTTCPDICTHSHMHFTPGPPFRVSMLMDLPLTLSKYLHTGRVKNYVQMFLGLISVTFLLNQKVMLPPAISIGAFSPVSEEFFIVNFSRVSIVKLAGIGVLLRFTRDRLYSGR